MDALGELVMFACVYLQIICFVSFQWAPLTCIGTSGVARSDRRRRRRRGGRLGGPGGGGDGRPARCGRHLRETRPRPAQTLQHQQ